MHGRRASNAVLRAASEAFANSFQLVSRASLWFVDLKTAFPPLFHAYFRWVLRCSGMPACARKAILSNYRRAAVLARPGGRDHGWIQVGRGIKQGCTMSGTSWAVAFDPVIRFLSSAVEIIPALLTVYIDDIAIAAAQLADAGRRLLRVFDIAGPGVSIAVKAKKTQVVACYVHEAAGVAKERVAEARLAEVLVVGVARHLGFDTFRSGLSIFA